LINRLALAFIRPDPKKYTKNRIYKKWTKCVVVVGFRLYPLVS